jgi:O-antigen/teichoic acid export membrane protein
VSKNNNITIQAFWVGVGSLSSFALALLSAAILSRYFDKAEYGTYRQILYVYNTLLIIFAAGLPRVFNYFLPRYSLSQGKDIVRKITNVLFLSGLVFSVFLFSFSGLIADILKNPELSKGLKYFSPIPMLLLPTLGIEGIFSTYKKTIYIAIYNTISRILMLLFIVLPVIIFKGTYLYAIYGWIAVSIITLIIAYFFKGIPFKGISLEKSQLHFKDILKYSLPLVSASLAGIAFRSANQFYISRYFGPEVFGGFSNGFIEIPMVRMITGATSTVLMPIFSKIIYDKSDITQLTNLWRNALQKSAVLIYPMVIFFLFYSKEVVTIVYSDAYTDSAKYFLTAMTLNFFNVIIFAPLLLAIGETRFYARLHYGLAIAAWIIEYIAIIIFKTPMSVAISFVVISICGIVIALIYSSNKIGVPFLKLFPAGQFLKIAAHSFASLLPVYLLLKYLLPQTGDLISISLALIGYLLILLISSKWVKINYLETLIPLLKK